MDHMEDEDDLEKAMRLVLQRIAVSLVQIGCLVSIDLLVNLLVLMTLMVLMMGNLDNMILHFDQFEFQIQTFVFDHLI